MVWGYVPFGRGGMCLRGGGPSLGVNININYCPPQGPSTEPRHSPTARSYGVAVSYQRGTPVGSGRCLRVWCPGHEDSAVLVVLGESFFDGVGVCAF